MTDEPPPYNSVNPQPGAPYQPQTPYPPQQGAGPYQPSSTSPYPPQATGSYPPQATGGQPPHYDSPKGAMQGYNDPAGTGYQQNVYPPTGYQAVTVQDAPVHTIVVQGQGFGAYPKSMQCPKCHAEITTEQVYSTGGFTWLSVGLICLFGGWCGCQCIPLCVKAFKDVDHYCPQCKAQVGKFCRI